MIRLTLLLFLLSTALTAQTVADRITAFAARPELSGATVAVDVIDVATGKRVAAYQPGKALIPASTQKLITTAAAYDLLGPGHRFTTDLVYTGQLADGALRGDVYILGGGDPTLASPYMDGVPRLNALIDRWRAAIAAAGITHIEGRIIGDDSYFGTDGASSGWPWADLGNYYGAGAYGLNINENSYKLDLLQRGNEGATPMVQGTRPRVPGLAIANELRSGPRGSGDQAYIFAAPFSDLAIVRGTIPIGSKRFTIRGSLPDPALFAAGSLATALAAAGIAVALPAETSRTVGTGRFRATTRLDRYASPTLEEIVARTNLRSVNLYAEALLREMNKARGGKPESLSSTEVITDWLKTKGVATGTAQLVDGSGLATRNFFSPAMMTALLRTQADNAGWRKSIPLAGRTGSLRGYLKGRTAAGRLWAKSGSVNAVRCYAGYATGPDGRELAFAIMVNNYTSGGSRLRNWMLELMNALCEAPLR